MTTHDWDWHDGRGFRRIINVSGMMTGLGASVAAEEVRQATAEAMRHFVSLHELQATASRVVARATGAEAGCITASSSAGISLAIAGCLTGHDPAAVEALPRIAGARRAVAIQAGHLCSYGAPVETAIRLTGAEVRPVGTSTLVSDHQLAAALDDTVAAALFVVSHHVVRRGQMPLARFAEIAHARGVPVIVDAASEYDLRGFLAQGADLVIYSGHKFLGGPTSGIIAGRRERVRAAYLQNLGIGRGMKVGKESIVGVMAALEAWERRDAEAIRARERAALELWREALHGLAGVEARIVPDPTGNPLDRLQVDIDEARAGASAARFAAGLAAQTPALIVRDLDVDLGYFQLDPCNLLPGQAEIVAESLRRVLADGAALSAIEPVDPRNDDVNAYLSWPG